MESICWIINWPQNIWVSISLSVREVQYLPVYARPRQLKLMSLMICDRSKVFSPFVDLSIDWMVMNPTRISSL